VYFIKILNNFPLLTAQTMQNDNFERITKEIFDLDLAKPETTTSHNITSEPYLHVESPPSKNPKQLSRQQTVESEHYSPDNSFEKLDEVKPEAGGKIQLTERVLQWLDLAGKQTLIHNEITRDKGEQSKCHEGAVLRRVQTTESLMSMTSVKTLKPSLSFSSKPPRITIRRVATTESLMRTTPSLRLVRPSLRRSESLHHLSITFDNESVEKPPESSEEICQSPGIRFDLFPTTLRCSKKFLSCVHSRTLTRSHSDASNYSEGNESTATTTATIEEFSKRKRYPKHLLRKSSTLEQRYKSIINRHILETTCNEQSAKRQLHIFLPKSTNNRNQLAAGDGANECDSCLSTIISDISKS
jgi:hypothetical protein